jgi:hypothetical protein
VDKPEELLREYRELRARYAYLRTQENTLEHLLKMCEGSMISDMVSLSQEITGMPHGTGISDPTRRVAMDIMSGNVTPFVEQIREELRSIRAEIIKIGPKVRLAELLLGAVTEREREIVEIRIIGDASWNDALAEMNERHNNSYSKRSLQRLYSRAIEKMENVVR